MKVYKYPLLIVDEQTIKIPSGARFLTVQVQHSTPCLWALVNPDAEAVDYRIRTAGTGHLLSEEWQHALHLGTYQLSNEMLVFHVFGRPLP